MDCPGHASSLLMCDMETQGHHSGTMGQDMLSCTHLLLAAIEIFMAETQILTKFNALDLTVEDATTIQGLASLCQAVFSPRCSGSSCWRHWLPGLPPQCKQAFQEGFPVITAIFS